MKIKPNRDEVRAWAERIVKELESEVAALEAEIHALSQKKEEIEVKIRWIKRELR